MSDIVHVSIQIKKDTLTRLRKFFIWDDDEEINSLCVLRSGINDAQINYLLDHVKHVKWVNPDTFNNSNFSVSGCDKHVQEVKIQDE